MSGFLSYIMIPEGREKSIAIYLALIKMGACPSPLDIGVLGITIAKCSKEGFVDAPQLRCLVTYMDASMCAR